MYVYILKTQNHIPSRYYTGITNNLKQRLADHNEGRSKYTAAYRPWIYKNFFWFSNAEKAYAFEKYLKSGSGRVFVCKHFGDE
jgi:putative endonuclease